MPLGILRLYPGTVVSGIEFRVAPGIHRVRRENRSAFMYFHYGVLFQVDQVDPAEVFQKGLKNLVFISFDHFSSSRSDVLLPLYCHARRNLFRIPLNCTVSIIHFHQAQSLRGRRKTGQFAVLSLYDG